MSGKSFDDHVVAELMGAALGTIATDLDLHAHSHQHQAFGTPLIAHAQSRRSNFAEKRSKMTEKGLSVLIESGPEAG
jgi:hypothetical protein